ncbi:MAG TPA: DNA recombination protein RmuC, partial [Bacteroidales bacterium]|nr:DNA recombination protein RmuC [Bacteroidales bacterium]
FIINLTTMGIIYITGSAIIGFLIAYIVLGSSYRKKLISHQNTLQVLEKEKLTSSLELESRIGIFEERISNLNNEKEKTDAETIMLREQLNEKNSDIARMQTMQEQLQERLEKQKDELTELQQKFTTEFENLANKIFKQHSQEFVQTSGKNLNELINPLKERLQTFEKKVQDAYDVERHDKISLKQEVKNLFELNRKLSEDAENLTRALKGDTKKQGNWGEIVLERVLERSGLTKGVEYETQVSTRDEEGQILRPDVVIHLPENKHLIIDSKVSLLAYESFVSSENPEEKEKYINQHVASVRNHIKGLSDKNYQAAYNFDTPDFVLLFLPVEPAFSAALQHDPDLFSYAWERKIVLVSPTTLLATLKTVSSIWKQEKQTQNALEIARQGGALYDKFVNFIEDMQKIGNQLNTLSKTYDEANKKLSTGSGNLVRRAERLKKLGVKSLKSIPSQYLLNEDDDEKE